MPEITLQELLPSLISAAAVVIGFWILYTLLSRGTRKLAAQLVARDEESQAEIETWANQVLTFLRRGIELAAGLVVLFLILRGLGLGGLTKFSWENVADWFTGQGLRILLVTGGAYLLTRVLAMLISRLPSLLMLRMTTDSKVERDEQRQRLDTISHLLQNITWVAVMSMATLIILREMGLDITPILTGLGIGGLALGFGAQNLVRDFISGFFIILENQVAVGDVANINGKGGQVEAIRLRTIVLRGLDGTVHVIPNGSITELSNMTKDFSYYVIDLGVAYKEDTDRVVEVVKEVAAEMRRDPQYAEMIMNDLEVLGVDQFADSAVVIKVRIKTLPIKQWAVGREMRRRIKHAFDAKGIEIPFPHLSVYVGEATKPLAVKIAEQTGKA